VKIKRYCTCGGYLTGVIVRMPQLQAQLDNEWALLHIGPGHAPCDAKTAANARRNHERRAESAEQRKERV